MAYAKITSWAQRVFTPDKAVQKQFALFQELLREDKKCLKLITALEEIAQKPILTDWARIAMLSRTLSAAAQRLTRCLMQMRPGAYDALAAGHDRIDEHLQKLLPQTDFSGEPPYALPLATAWDHQELLGGKALALARILRDTAIPVPPGFVVTTNAYHAFLQGNNLQPVIARHLRGLNLRRPDRLQKISHSLQQAVMAGEVPQAVQESIAAAMQDIPRWAQTNAWAVRSSAWAEDGQVSFAGQYATVLDVQHKDVLTAYKTVLASKYTPRAMTYRLHYGLDNAQTPMAVLVLPMITPRASGVMYTLDPLDMCQGACLVISAVQGLGDRLVEGSVVPDIFLVSRQDPDQFLARQPAPKPAAAESAAAKTNNLCLDDKTASTLAKWGLELEALTGSPQDVEWAQDQAGGLFVLQSRPIQRLEPAQTGEESRETPRPADHVSKLLEVGTPASVGIAAGPVHRLVGEARLEDVPAQSILVTPAIPPSLVRLVYKVKAVLAESGGKASHFASVAREFGLPLVVGLGDLTQVLEDGQIVTVDAYRGLVYQGEVAELIAWQQRREAKPPVPFQEKMGPLMDLVSSLTLVDPASPDFSPGKCQSFHDLVRFVHEKGTQEMFSLVDDKSRGLRRAKILETDIPIVMHVLDLGEGLTASARQAKAVLPKHFQSAPMQAVWAGLADEDIAWAKGLLHMDWDRFDQVSAGIFSLKSSLLSSYALVARHYAHLLLRFGYHFAVLDALSGSRPEENHIQFRFKGGGGASEKKAWRLTMLKKILTSFGFRVVIKEDLLEAKCMRMDLAATQLRLTVLGYLLGRTPLLDMALESEADALRLAEEILKKWHDKGKNQ
ncbi:MAG TPA: hypothetical protein ENN39_01610 [Desulfonatronum sp.]|nr:hypothetical protein [Desulfonatronum sp.]